MCRQYVGGGRRSRMESNAAGAAGSGFGSSAPAGIGAGSSSSSASAATPSLKKLKREAAQRRKAQARSLKLRAEEQERLQRLEIDALVEQQRLQRLERQRRKEDAERLAQEASSLSFNSSSTSGNEDVKCTGAASTKLKHHHNSGSTNQQVQTSTSSSSQEGLEESKKAGSPSAWPTHKDQAALNKGSNKQVTGVQQNQQHKQQQQQQQQQEQMRALVENRRRLARGPRSGNLVLTMTEPSITTATSSTSNSSVLPLEDHRVVSTEYQAAGTQALMRVTLLAAGFVIGARGISARLIGQITGAIIQSWTESSSACRSNNSSNHNNHNNNSVPIRLFRIQGKKAVVQAAVSLVEQAVAKYKELCECKRRGEFVQREHVINGVEFYYQPPPRKAFAASESVTAGSKSSPPPSSNSSPSTSTSAAAPPSPISTSEVPLASSLAFPPHHVWLHHLQQAQQAQQQKQLQAQQIQLLQQKNQQRSESGFAPDMNNPEDVSDVVPISNGFTSAATTSTPVEQQQAGQNPSFEQKKLDSLSSSVDGTNGNPAVDAAPVSSAWTKNANGEQQVSQVESSLFSIFGNGGLPLPIAQDCRAPPNAPSSVSSTPFDFPKYDFFREFLPAFPPQLQHQRDDYNLFAQHQHHHHHIQQLPFMTPLQQQQQQQQGELCTVCVERPSGTRILACGHASVCLSCVQGLATCPVCREKIVGWQPALRPPSSGSEMTGTSYDLWNLGPCSNQEATTL